MKTFLEENGFEVHQESHVFKVPYTKYAIAQRVDFLAFRNQDILIVECKGSPFEKRKVFGAVLQITMYMRLYRMLQRTPNPQLYFKEFDPLLIKETGILRGALAIPSVALKPTIRDVFAQVYNSLQTVDLIEPNLEIWELKSS